MALTVRHFFTTFLALILCGGGFLLGQETTKPDSSAEGVSKLRKKDPSIPVEEVIKKFADKEEEFRRARDFYTYRQTLDINVLTLEGRKTGERRFEITDVLFDDKGRRIEKVLKAPVSTIESVIFTPEDMYDIQHVFPFLLTSTNIDKYNLTYRGMELVDEIDTYVFDVSPKELKKEERLFEGKIWVDQKDLQIVKTHGRTVFEITRKNKDQRFPRFETIRGNIDGKYWFPIYTMADDILHFPTGQDVHIREKVIYENYRKYEAEVKFTVTGEMTDKKKEEKK
jgi:hypothetical protein